jgi:aminopeptidase-like protein
MSLLKEIAQKDLTEIGEGLHRFATDLYPICRSITGDGLRQTLAAIQQRVRLQISEVPTGTEVFDWTIPKEWNIKAAFIKDMQGRRILDFSRCNLGVLNYSAPIHETMPLTELRQHLFTIPEHPDWIPYRTAYYEENWGFCLSHNQLRALAEGEYELYIDSTLAEGHMTYGECYLPGRCTDEVLISCHICHPSLANDNLSGLSVATALAEFLSGRDLRYSYRFLFIPGTIGAITWLSRNRDKLNHIRHGLVLTGIGDDNSFHYKRSRRGDAEIDKAVEHVLRHHGESNEILEFSPYGYDERQYCSPGLNLPVGCLMRSIWGTFPEYHTSADDLSFIKPQRLAESFLVITSIIDVLEMNECYCNLRPYCEPQLGRRGLYRTTGGESIEEEINARLWVLNFSDGEHSLLDIAERSGLSFSVIATAAQLLFDNGLLKAVPLPASH